jgi:hypothetical protein
MALGLSKRQNGVNLITKPFYTRNDGIEIGEKDIITETTCVGVDYADE